jgi:hypothetical protein
MEVSFGAACSSSFACVTDKAPRAKVRRKDPSPPVGASVLCAPAAELGWAMADELEKQLENIQNTVAEIVEAVKKLRDDRAAAGETPGSEINERLRRFLERKKQA